MECDNFEPNATYSGGAPASMYPGRVTTRPVAAPCAARLLCGALACLALLSGGCEVPPKPWVRPDAAPAVSVASVATSEPTRVKAPEKGGGSDEADEAADAEGAGGGAGSGGKAGSEAKAAVCPSDMVHVKGDYCLTVRHKCLDSLAPKSATGALGFDDQCISYEPGSARCGTRHKKVKVNLKLIAGNEHDQKGADPKRAFGQKFMGVKAGDEVNGCTVERILGYGRGVARAGSIVELDCPPVIPLSFCMDRHEFPNKKGATPARLINWYEAQKSCERLGKRLCEEHEWTLACEGPERQPYPNGWERGIWTPDSAESRAGCNISRCHADCPVGERDENGHCNQYDPILKKEAPRPACYVEPQWVQQQMPFQPEAKKKEYLDMVDRASGNPAYPFLLPSGSMDRCVSPYGVHDLTGNIDEWVQSFDHHETKISNLKGGHYLHNCRARCRPVTTRHGPYYFQATVGFRCCKDVSDE